MRKSVIFFLFMLAGMFLFGETPNKDLKNTMGFIFSPGYQSPDLQIYTYGFRGVHSFNQIFGTGLEVNCQQSLNLYGNSDALTGIGFIRIKPFKVGFFAEFGFQYFQVVSSSRVAKKTGCLPFIGLGYRVKLNNRMNLEFQFRPITVSGREFEYNFTTRNNIPAKCFVGVNYSF